VSKFVQPFLHLMLHLGTLGPLFMGVLDSSFLVLPFGNDLVVVLLVAQHHQAVVSYVLMAASGSTIGALLLASVARKLGEQGIIRLAGKRRYDRLKRHMGQHAGIAVAVGGLAPPPFPFTTVIAGAAALHYPLWRLLLVNFFARAVRFTLLSLLAIQFGHQVLRVAASAPFEWTMTTFIALCVIASVFSVVHWLRRPH
jgi:membrane protein YqaA with SNARE-associated domain